MQRLLFDRAEIPLFTPLHFIELRNSLRMLAFRGAIDPATVGGRIADLDDDLRKCRLIVSVIDFDVLARHADSLSSAHTVDLGTRALDIMHVAAAQVLQCEAFLTYDARQRKLAEAVGFVTLPT